MGNDTTVKEHYACMLSHFSCVWLLRPPWTVICQALLYMGFSRQPISFFRGIFMTQGSNPGFLRCRQNLFHWDTGEASRNVRGNSRTTPNAINCPQSPQGLLGYCPPRDWGWLQVSNPQTCFGWPYPIHQSSPLNAFLSRFSGWCGSSEETLAYSVFTTRGTTLNLHKCTVSILWWVILPHLGREFSRKYCQMTETILMLMLTSFLVFW